MSSATEAPAGSELDPFAIDSGETPLLLRKKVLAGVVAGFVALFALYLLLAEIFNFSLEIDAKPFQEWVDDRGIWAPIVYIGILAVSVLFAPIPNAPIFIAAGLAWGAILGTVYSLAGLMVGSILAFYVSRRFGRRYLPYLVGRKTAARIDTMAETMGGTVIFWARMLPVVNFDWISFVAGMTAVSFRTFAIWSFVGMIFPTWVAVAAGDSLGKDIRLTFAIGALWIAGILFSAVFFWWRRRHVKNRAAGSG